MKVPECPPRVFSPGRLLGAGLPRVSSRGAHPPGAQLFIRGLPNLTALVI